MKSVSVLDIKGKVTGRNTELKSIPAETTTSIPNTAANASKSSADCTPSEASLTSTSLRLSSIVPEPEKHKSGMR